MAKKTVKDIVRECLPEMEIVEPTKGMADTASPTGKPGASLDRLREKYLGSAAREETGPTVDGGEAAEKDVEVRQIRPKRAPADPVDDPGPRAVIISKRKGIIGSQG